jgi:hypothetical protein
VENSCWLVVVSLGQTLQWKPFERLLAFPLGPEERLQQLGASACQHAAFDLRAVVQLRVVQDLHNGVDCTRLRIVSAVDQTLYARMYQRSGTHRARLNCSKQLAVSETMVTNDGTGFAQCDDLGVRGGVLARKIAVPAVRKDVAVADHNGAYGHFSHLQSAPRVPQGFQHEEFVGVIVSRRSSVVGWG